ncbi:MAG TPA: hypothetical protein VMG74_10885 [Gaiellaceae bacterium]|nr:hypothetical protein [Gaiellaceae bacterium]
MRAMAIDGFGTAPTLHVIPTPVAGEGEIRAKVSDFADGKLGKLVVRVA